MAMTRPRAAARERLRPVVGGDDAVASLFEEGAHIRGSRHVVDQDDAGHRLTVEDLRMGTWLEGCWR
jgi:hypothetical protein